MFAKAGRAAQVSVAWLPRAVGSSAQYTAERLRKRTDQGLAGITWSKLLAHLALPSAWHFTPAAVLDQRTAGRRAWPGKLAEPVAAGWIGLAGSERRAGAGEAMRFDALGSPHAGNICYPSGFPSPSLGHHTTAGWHVIRTTASHLHFLSLAAATLRTTDQSPRLAGFRPQHQVRRRPALPIPQRQDGVWNYRDSGAGSPRSCNADCLRLISNLISIQLPLNAFRQNRTLVQTQTY